MPGVKHHSGSHSRNQLQQSGHSAIESLNKVGKRVSNMPHPRCYIIAPGEKAISGFTLKALVVFWRYYLDQMLAIDNVVFHSNQGSHSLGRGAPWSLASKSEVCDCVTQRV